MAAQKCYCLYNEEYTKMVFKVDKDKVLTKDIADWDINRIHDLYFSDNNYKHLQRHVEERSENIMQ